MGGNGIFSIIRDLLAPLVLTWELLSVALTLTTLLLRRQLISPKLSMHVESTYRIKKHLPDVRDGRDVCEDAGASTSDVVHYSQDWADDYYMGH